MEKKLALRPTHTGSARRDASRFGKAQSVQTPTSQEVYRVAKKPLILAGGRRGIAIRQRQDGPIEMKIQTASGQVYWREATGVVPMDIIKVWVREGF